MGEDEKNPETAHKPSHRTRGGKSGKTAGKTAHKRGLGAAEKTPSRNLIIAVVVVIALFAVALYLFGRGGGPQGTQTSTTQPTGNQYAASNDIVSVEYVGSLLNGTIFDTSKRDVAEANRIYNPLRTYEPIKFTLGTGGIIKGFDEAIIGMKVGEEKEFTAPPEKAYGYPTDKLITSVPVVQRSPIIQNVSIERFKEDIGVDPYVGLTFKIPNATGYQVTWPMKVLELYNDTVVFRFEPDRKLTMNTVFGPAEVYGDGEEVVVKLNATVGQKVVTLVGPAKIISVTAENITLDYNHELAGKTLKFQVKLLSLAKQ